MTIRLSFKNICLFVGMMLVTFAGSDWAYLNNANRVLEYISYGILLVSIVYEFIMDRGQKKRKRETIYIFLIVMFLFSIGLLKQEKLVSGLFELLMTMVAIAVPALLSDHYIDSFERLKTASNAVLCGVMLSFIVALMTGIDVALVSANEGILGITGAFTGGIRFKNYFGADMCIVFIGHYLYSRFIRKTPSGRWIMLLSVVVIFLSNSRGAIILLLVFWICMRMDLIRKIYKRQRGLVVLGGLLLAVTVAIWFYRDFALESANYMLRYQGFMNYITSSDMDLNKLLFGISSRLYGQEQDYVRTFKSIYGWDGTMEFAVLDILVKNGLLGLLGYMIIFTRNIRTALKSSNWEYKTALLAVAIMLLVSSLVETYIQSIHSPVGMYCYLAMDGFVGLCRRNVKETDKTAESRSSVAVGVQCEKI